MRRLTLAAMVLMLAACSEAEAPPAPVEPALPPGREAIYAAAQEGPEAFVRALYSAYAADALGEAPPVGREPLYGRTLNAALMHDGRKGSGRMVDYDVVCDCQDIDGMSLTSVTVNQTDRNTATAEVVFVNGGETKTQTLGLVREGPSWRVGDVTRAGEEVGLLDRLVASL